MASSERQLLESFVEEAHRRCAAITAAVAMIELGQGPVADLAEQRIEAHALKGAAGVLGLDQIAALAAQLEQGLEEAARTEPLDPRRAGELQAWAAEIESGARAALDSAPD